MLPLLSYVAATIFHRLNNNLPSFYSGVVYSGQVQTPDESYYDEAGQGGQDEAGVVVPQLATLAAVQRRIRVIRPVRWLVSVLINLTNATTDKPSLNQVAGSDSAVRFFYSFIYFIYPPTSASTVELCRAEQGIHTSDNAGRSRLATPVCRSTTRGRRQAPSRG